MQDKCRESAARGRRAAGARSRTVVSAMALFSAPSIALAGALLPLSPHGSPTKPSQGAPLILTGEVEDPALRGEPLFPGGTVYPDDTLYPELVFTTLFVSRSDLTPEQRRRIFELGIETVEDFMNADPAALAPVFETDAETVAGWLAALRDLPQER
jgi:hypothetical protein